MSRNSCLSPPGDIGSLLALACSPDGIGKQLHSINIVLTGKSASRYFNQKLLRLPWLHNVQVHRDSLSLTPLAVHAPHLSLSGPMLLLCSRWRNPLWRGQSLPDRLSGTHMLPQSLVLCQDRGALQSPHTSATGTMHCGFVVKILFGIFSIVLTQSSPLPYVSSKCSLCEHLLGHTFPVYHLPHHPLVCAQQHLTNTSPCATHPRFYICFALGQTRQTFFLFCISQMPYYVPVIIMWLHGATLKSIYGRRNVEI